jgi:hypothetical protein
MSRKTLEPGANCGEEAKNPASEDRTPGDVHGVKVAKGLGERQISRRKKLAGMG